MKNEEKSLIHPGIKLMILILTLGVFIFLGNYLQKQDNNKLKNSIKTKAVISKIGFRGIRRKGKSYVKFTVKNKKIVAAIHGDYSSFEIGDTIEIIYSKVDPTIIKVTNKYYEKIKEIIKNNENK